MKYKLKDICLTVTDGSHFSPKAQDEGYPMFSVKDMLEYGFDYSKCKKISEEDFNKMKSSGCVPQKEDVLIAKDGSYLKEIFVCKETREEAILSSIAIFRPNQSIINPFYLCYLLKSPKVFNYISTNCVSGSALPRIVLKAFKEVEMEVPDIETQERIVSILKDIDNKAQNNSKINRNLAEQALSLFNEKFGGYDKESTIADISLNVTDGVHNTVKDDPDGEFLLLSCKNIKGGSLSIGDSERHINKETFEKLRKRTRLSKGDILLSSVGTIGELLLVNFQPNNIEFQRSVAIIKPNTNLVSSVYLYFALLAQKQEIIHAGHGAVQQCIFISDISGFSIHKPHVEELRQFDDVVVPMMDAITGNLEENKRLAQLRDSLLPRLISGELDVSDLEI